MNELEFDQKAAYQIWSIDAPKKKTQEVLKARRFAVVRASEPAGFIASMSHLDKAGWEA